MHHKYRWLEKKRWIGWLGVVVVLMASPAQTVNYTWSGAADGVFSDADNWTPAGGPPGTDDLAYFTAVGGAYTVTFANNVVNQRMILFNSDVTLNLGGYTYSNIANSVAVFGGSNSNSVTNFSTIVCTNGYLDVTGIAADSVPGFPTTVTFGTNLVIRQIAPLLTSTVSRATVNMQDGAQVTLHELRMAQSSSTQHMFSVDGSGTKLSVTNLTVGYTGTGTLAVAHSGSVHTLNAAYIGLGAGSHGMVDLTGAGTLLTNSSLVYVGYNGDGYVAVRDGALWHNGSTARLGQESSGTGTVLVTGTNSRLNSSMEAGCSGRGTLLVEDGGFVSGSMYVGRTAGSYGNVEMRGAGTMVTNTGAPMIGEYGEGHVLVTDDADWRVSAFVYGAYYSGATSAITITRGGSLSCRSIWMAGLNAASGGISLLAVTNGGSVLLSEILRVWAGGTVRVGSRGTIESATLELKTNSVVAVVLRGDESGALITTSGDADLGGATLSLAMADGFYAGPPVYTIVEAGGVLSGTFAGMPDGTIITVGHRRFHLNYDTDNQRVTLTHECPSGTVITVR